MRRLARTGEITIAMGQAHANRLRHSFRNVEDDRCCGRRASFGDRFLEQVQPARDLLISNRRVLHVCRHEVASFVSAADARRREPEKTNIFYVRSPLIAQSLLEIGPSTASWRTFS
jgi:hypothetical protein